MNWKYVIAGLVRRHVPHNILFLILELRGDSSCEETTPCACLETLTFHLEKKQLSFADKEVLEIGSGRYARFALQLVAAGAKRVTLIDPYAKSLDDPAHRSILIKDCEALGLKFDRVSLQIRVISSDITKLPAPSQNEKVDIAISHSVLEHVHNPGAVLECCWNWLNPGGHIHHFIDLRDHSLRFRFPFEMLTFSDRFWSRWMDLGGYCHVNRWRAPNYLEAARAIGFINVGYDVLSKDEAALKAILPRLKSQFRSIPEPLLAILMISLFGRKPLDDSHRSLLRGPNR